MSKEKISVIFRKEKFNDGWIKNNQYTTIAFFPEFKVNTHSGNIVCYTHIGNHSIAHRDYYHKTKKALPEEYRELLEELALIYDEYELVVKQKINWKHMIY